MTYTVLGGGPTQRTVPTFRPSKRGGAKINLNLGAKGKKRKQKEGENLTAQRRSNQPTTNLPTYFELLVLGASNQID